jgi:hypothetical protein
MTIGSVAKIAIATAGAVGTAAFELSEVYRDSQVAQRRSQIQMREQGVTSQRVFDDFKKYAEENAKAWHILPDHILQAETILTRTGVTSEAEIKKMTQLSADMAASYGEDITDVASQIAESSRSSGAALSFLDKHHAALNLREKELIQTMGAHNMGAQQLAFVLYKLGNQYQGNAVDIANVKGIWDEMRNVTLPLLGIHLGEAIDKTGFFEGALEKVNKQFENLDDYVTGKKDFKDFLGGIEPKLATTIKELNEIETILEKFSLPTSFTQAVAETEREFNAILGVLNDLKNMGPLGAATKLGVEAEKNSPVGQRIERIIKGKSHIEIDPFSPHFTGGPPTRKPFVTRASGGPFDGTDSYRRAWP